MSNFLRVQWTIEPRIPPQPWLPCSRCGDVEPFRTSGKIRLNANGRRLDAWLIYKCTRCDNTWNRPVVERRAVRDVDPATLDDLLTNDPQRVKRLAFDIDDLRRRSARVEEFADVDVRKAVLSGGVTPLSGIEILLTVSMPTCLRIDRLLASELGLSRTRILDLQRQGRLLIFPEGDRMLRRRVRDRMRISIDLTAEVDAADLWLAAGLPPDSQKIGVI